MRVVRSRVMGYCNGVSQVIRFAQDVIDRARVEGKKAYSIGWFIHNPSVVNHFISQGMEHIDTPEGHEPGIALIRAHGIADDLREWFIQAGFTLIDGTCGTVAHSQSIIRSVSEDEHVLIIGLHNHSEVKALSRVRSVSGRFVPVQIVQSVDEVNLLDVPSQGTIVTVVQTTFEHELFHQILERLNHAFPDRIVQANILCPSTKRRHDSLLSMIDEVEAVLVVGGKMSANTRALAELVESRKVPVWHIEEASQIPIDIFQYQSVGITAGTSTPEEDIRTVMDTLHKGAGDGTESQILQ
ncbi:MAG: hypothetical protein JXK93_04220 [Sphaerochaetaceae bacterium]|nr:hypothetical protein [Sphaerochaetaceae bacterium]